MQAHLDVLADSVVEGGRLPVLREEDHAHCLAEVVELETRAPDAGHDACIWDDFGCDAKFARAEDEVGVGGCAGDCREG